MSFDTWFLKGRIALAKHHSNDPAKCRSYPRVKRLTSQVETFARSQEGLSAFAEALHEHGDAGHCLLQGPLERPITDESRAGLTLRSAPMDRLTLDIDGVMVPGLRLEAPVTRDSFLEACEAIIDRLPSLFHDASYVAVASSSMGLHGNRVSFHLHFLLEHELQPEQLRDYLKSINLKVSFFSDRLDLTASGTALRWPVDICTAQNSRVVFIAPPSVDADITTPFARSGDRYQFVQKAHTSIDIIDHLVSMNEVQEMESKAINRLRRIRGLQPKTRKSTRVETDQGSVEVITNPDRCQMEFAYEKDDWVYYNVGGGDSNAYWVYKYNPTVVYNFKGEPNFSFQVADPDTYAWHIDQFFGDSNASADQAPPVPVVGIDYETDSGFKVLINPVNMEFVRRPAPCAKQNMDAFMVDHGSVLPDPVPTWTIRFNPTDTTVIDLNKRILNRYQPPDVIQHLADLEDDYLGITFGGAQWPMRKRFPTIYRLVWSLTGSDEEAFEHFINWFAWIVQNRQKTRTAWLFHGVQGTGKGVFHEQVATRLIGPDYTWLIKLRELENSSNAWMEQNILTVIDEFNLWSARNSQAIEGELKNMITDEHYAMRGLYKDHQKIRLFSNFILYSNDYDVLHLDESDRRFNVAPRQETPLIRRYPDIEKRIQNDLPGEVAPFATFLMSFIPDEERVSRALDNEAKASVRVASRTNEEDFFRAIREGDFSYFAPILDMNYTAVGIDYILPAQNHLKAILRDAAEDPLPVRVDTICTLYKCVFAKRDMTTQIFGKKLSRWGVSSGRLPDLNYGRGVYVQWQFGDMDREAMLDQYLTDFAKKKPDEAMEAEVH